MSHSQPQATTQSHCNSSALCWMNGSGSVNSNPIPPITAECSMELLSACASLLLVSANRTQLPDRVEKGHPPHLSPEVVRYVELDYLCHSVSSSSGPPIQAERSAGALFRMRINFVRSADP
jgi:hypothetical protein